MSRFVLLATAIVVAASLAAAQDGSADHGKIMGCYFGSWAFYRYQSIISPHLFCGPRVEIISFLQTRIGQI